MFKWGRVIPIYVLVILIISSFQFSYYISSNPGYGSGNCAECHNTGLNAWNSQYASSQLILDGQATESFWSDTLYRQSYIPMIRASKFYFEGGIDFYLHFRASQNSTHLFLIMDWFDPTINGTDRVNNDPADGISLMWNIDSDWDLNFEYGMKTHSGKIDFWMWKTDIAAEGTEPANDTGTTGTRTTVPVGTVIDADYTMDKGGWYADYSQNVQVAATYGNISNHQEQNYQVEFSRPLITNDPNDVQFNHTGYYDFSVAVFKENNGFDHYVTYSNLLWVYQPNDPGHVSTTTETIPGTTETETETETALGTTETISSTVTNTEYKNYTSTETLSNPASGLGFSSYIFIFSLITIVVVYNKRSR